MVSVLLYAEFTLWDVCGCKDSGCWTFGLKLDGQDGWRVDVPNSAGRRLFK
jgi:hypothetical protein